MITNSPNARLTPASLWADLMLVAFLVGLVAVARLLPLHSSASSPRAPGTWTEKDMSEAAVLTSSSAIKAISCG